MKERVDNRMRVRQPLLPTLVAHVEAQYETVRALLRAGTAVKAGPVTHEGRDYERIVALTTCAIRGTPRSGCGIWPPGRTST
ncbi:hypothetical protein ACWEQA_23850 [Nocardia sp. NPDC004085]